MNYMNNNKNWNKEIKTNFDNAANHYSYHSSIQKHFCYEIILLIEKLSIRNGEWFDLGSGIGFLADEIEKQFPQKNVCRIDFSEKMLSNNKKNSKTILWDLNKGLPIEASRSTLLISNFCLHWLIEPELALKDWFFKLDEGGFLIVCLPTSNSFPEWKFTCKENDFEYSGLTFPDSNSLIKDFKPNQIYSIKTYNYQENFKNVYKLFRNIINMGAHSTKSKRKSISELRAMQDLWPKHKRNSVNLTWEICILVLRK